MKIFITGASGMLASDVVPKLESLGHEFIKTDFRLRLPDIGELDIRQRDKVEELIGESKADFVFHLAAETNVDLCEKDPDHAYVTNTIGTENIVLACQKNKIPLVYISTAGVFYGDQTIPYSEFDAPRPANVYGQSKLEGEKIVEKLLDRYFIFRAGWMVGGWDIDKKFVRMIVEQLKAGKKEILAVSDKFGSPTFTKDFAANIMNVVETGRYGLYHMTNKGTCSRYDIALKIVEYMGMEGKVTVKPVNSAYFPLPAMRADSEMMKNYRLDLIGENNMPHWEDALKDYILTNKDK